MGSNYYIVKAKPTIHEAVHIGKCSWGWEMGWQATYEGDWPRWCDEDPMADEDGRYLSDRGLPHSINSVDDIRAYLETGEWLLVDEYGTVYGEEPHEEDLNGGGQEKVNDWRTELAELEAWDGGKSGWNERNPDKPVTWELHRHTGGFHDRKGNHFSREGFC